MPKEFANSQDLVQVEKVRDNTLILKDGSYRQILMVQGTNFSLKSLDEQDALTASYQNFLNGLDFGIQILIHSRKINVQKYLDDLTGRMNSEPSALLQSQISEYKDFVAKFVEENAIMEKTFLIVIPWYPPAAIKSSSFSSIPFFGKKKDAKQENIESEEDFTQNLLQLKQRTTQVMEGISGMGLESIVLSDQELIELVYNFYNPETVEKETLNLPNEGK